MATRHVLQREISPADVGIDGAAGNVTTTGSWIGASGFGQATILVSYVKTGVHTPTNITFNIETSSDGGVTAYALQAGSVAAGVATLSDLQYLKATGGATKAFVVDLPINYEMFRINSLAGGSGVLADTLSVTVRLGAI